MFVCFPALTEQLLPRTVKNVREARLNENTKKGENKGEEQQRESQNELDKLNVTSSKGLVPLHGLFAHEKDTKAISRPEIKFRCKALFCAEQEHEAGHSFKNCVPLQRSYVHFY